MGKCPVSGQGASEDEDAYRLEIRKSRPKATIRDVVRLMHPFYWPGTPCDRSHPTLFLRLYVILAVVCLFCGKAMNLLAPYFLGKTINHLSTGEKRKSISNLVVAVVMFFLGTGFDELRNLLYGYVQCKGINTMALQIYQHLHSMNYQWFVESKSGEVIRCMIRGMESMRELTRFGVLLLIPTIIEVIAVCLLFAIYFRLWILTVTVVVGLTLYIILTILLTNWRNKTRRAAVQRDDDMHNISNDGLNNFETVKYYTNEKYEVMRYTTAARQQQKCQWRVLKSLSLLNVCQEVVKQLTIMLCLLFSVFGVLDNHLQVGDVVAIQNYLFYLFRPLFLLGTMYSMICNAIAGIQSVADMMKAVPEVVDKPNAIELHLDENKDVAMIEFRNVSFSYPNNGDSTSTGMVKNITFKIPKGQSLALVGTTGSGKTTISRLLCRFYDVDEGQIFVNGVDITEVTQESLRRSIGVVSQDTVLFHASIRDNIRYAKLDASDDEIYEALKQARLYDRIMTFPEKLDTVVGERGIRLSGGEKQRVSIARCFLKNPSIIILDEATSALDSKTEAQIQTTLSTLFQNRTVITIAHRLSTILNCTSIMLLEAGSVKEYGSHIELLHLNGQYKSMWEAQQHSPVESMKERTTSH